MGCKPFFPLCLWEIKMRNWIAAGRLSCGQNQSFDVITSNWMENASPINLAMVTFFNLLQTAIKACMSLGGRCIWTLRPLLYSISSAGLSAADQPLVFMQMSDSGRLSKQPVTFSAPQALDSFSTLIHSNRGACSKVSFYYHPLFHCDLTEIPPFPQPTHIAATRGLV